MDGKIAGSTDSRDTELFLNKKLYLLLIYTQRKKLSTTNFKTLQSQDRVM